MTCIVILFCVLFAIKYFHIIFFIVLFHRSTMLNFSSFSAEYSITLLDLNTALNCWLQNSVPCRPQTIEGQFPKRLCNLFTSFGFQWHDPTILAEYINYSQEVFVALDRSGKR